MNAISDLIKKPTFISIIFIILTGFGVPLIVYQLFTFHSSENLGITIEIIGLLILFGLLVTDRFLLRSISNKKLSIIEVILVTGYLIYYYFTHDHSFSIG
ncbi:hypothetical protein EG344_01295 [Chryseobacterium sp. G0162]|uniref:hypothetical protein n=1 Tax=unclassified Chryseobacterium TaxID=2593645 RepID=UPI000F4D6FE5|nr:MULTISPECIES: hypothetical protein [unclassified Chryseobacterium]AZB07575.1 hypothetical protein EG344_01295 [Chryseobacterium sp. G0162]